MGTDPFKSEFIPFVSVDTPLLLSELRCSIQKGSKVSSNQARRFSAPSPFRSNAHPVEILETRSRRPDRGGNRVGELLASSALYPKYTISQMTETPNQ